MPKSLVLGNGNMLICFDKHGYVKDFYFPFVGLENHAGRSYVHRIGVWVDEAPGGAFSWLHDGSWTIRIESVTETLAGDIEAVNSTLGVRLHFKDIVYNEKNIFIRKVRVVNLTNIPREIKVFFNQEFELYGSALGDTAYYDPIHHVIIHYKGRRVFLINGKVHEKGFDEYSIGMFGIEGKEGTYKDAEDGSLSGNAIEHGSVDSVIGFSLRMEGKKEQIIEYWVACAKSIHEVHELNRYTLQKRPEHLIKTASDFWYAWVNKQDFNFFELSQDVVDLFKKSLLIMRSHVDNSGSILASGDSDMLQHGKDTYGYMWPRDAAFAAMALDKAGDFNVARRFFELCNTLLSDDGYFFHKYRPDGSLGSSWHPWVRDGILSLPIQEDETALVIYALWQHYQLTRDIEFIESIYNTLIKKAADFMLMFRDQKSGLPLPSYDLWEEKYGVSTFTSASVAGALTVAAKFANLFGKKESEEEYNRGAFEIRKAIMTHLYSEQNGTFYKMINFNKDTIIQDSTVDMSSIFGMYRFNVLPVTDRRISRAISVVEEKLLCKTQTKGVARYEGDMYYKVGGDVPGNPWIITTLWLLQYYIAKAVEKSDFTAVTEWFSWVTEKALPSGVLPEQINPYTGEHISATPLTWSHAEFVISVLSYLERLEQLGIGAVRKPIR